MNASISTLKRKITIHSLLAFILVIFGMAVVMIALYMPPIGEIHPSVITVFGMLLVAAGAFIGIDLNFQIKSFVEAVRQYNTNKQPSENETT